MINYVNGNLLDAPENILGHQVNCQFVMGAGLAKQIRDKYPEVYRTYMAAKGKVDMDSLLGKIQLVETVDGKTVVNVFGQYGYGRNALYTDYDALERALEKLRRHAEENSLTVALPYGLGCGLAGGNWSIVEDVIEKTFDGYEVTIYKYE